MVLFSFLFALSNDNIVATSHPNSCFTVDGPEKIHRGNCSAVGGDPLLTVAFCDPFGTPVTTSPWVQPGPSRDTDFQRISSFLFLSFSPLFLSFFNSAPHTFFPSRLTEEAHDGGCPVFLLMPNGAPKCGRSYPVVAVKRYESLKRRSSRARYESTRNRRHGQTADSTVAL